MNLAEIMEDFAVTDITSSSFSVYLVGGNQSWICVFDHGVWLIYSKLRDIIEFVGRSRCDCLMCINYFYGLPF